jgi:hypothetical protein
MAYRFNYYNQYPAFLKSANSILNIAGVIKDIKYEPEKDNKDAYGNNMSYLIQLTNGKPEYLEKRYTDQEISTALFILYDKEGNRKEISFSEMKIGDYLNISEDFNMLNSNNSYPKLTFEVTRVK